MICKNRKITIVVPPSNYTPSRSWDDAAISPLEGATLAGTLLQEADYEVSCFDLRLGMSQRASALSSACESMAVCLAGVSDSFSFVKKFCSELKSNDVRIPIVLGGPLSNFSWDTILRTTSVDYCLVGECERVIVKLIKHLSNQELPKGLPVAFLHNEEVIAPEINPKINMNEAPCPDYRLWKTSFNNQFPPRLLYYSTQRGCRAKCSFCAIPGKWRPAHIHKITSELITLKKLGIRKLFFSDPTFNTNISHCLDVANVIKQEIGLPWACHVRAKPASQGFFKIIKQSGCQAVFLGIESAEENLLRQYNKGTTLKDIASCLAFADDVSLPIWGFLILGLPGETEKSLQKMKDFAAHHDFIPRANFATPFPGSALFQLYLQDALSRGGKHDDIVVNLLEQISSLKYDSTDEPIELPGRKKELIPALKETMAWMTQTVTNRVKHISLEART